jgi:predicted nucleic acid-binding Zn ribbon protein
MTARGRRRRGQPRQVGGVIGQVLDELGLESAASAFRIGERWSDWVGEEVARHCRPVQVRGRVLEAEVDSSVWAQQLQMRRPAILAILRRELGDEAPSELRFRVGYTPRP